MIVRLKYIQPKNVKAMIGNVKLKIMKIKLRIVKLKIIKA